MNLSRTSIPSIILALRNPEDALKLQRLPTPGWVFILGGAIGPVIGATRKLSSMGWTVFIHVDMVKGLTNDADGIRFLQESASPCGIISTHPYALSHAKKLGLLCIQRIFLLDSQSIESGLKQVSRGDADIIEVLPGILPEIISSISESVLQPLIAGGLITTQRQIAEALKAGAVGVSTSSRALISPLFRPVHEDVKLRRTLEAKKVKS